MKILPALALYSGVALVGVAASPALVTHDHDKIGGAKLQALGRTRQGKVFSVVSADAGKTWGSMTLIDSLPNPNSGTERSRSPMVAT